MEVGVSPYLRGFRWLVLVFQPVSDTVFPCRFECRFKERVVRGRSLSLSGASDIGTCCERVESTEAATLPCGACGRMHYAEEGGCLDTVRLNRQRHAEVSRHLCQTINSYFNYFLKESRLSTLFVNLPYRGGSLLSGRVPSQIRVSVRLRY